MAFLNEERVEQLLTRLKEYITNTGAPLNHNHTPPIGSIHITPTNTNPATQLGGEWELVDKSLKRAVYEADDASGFVESIGAHVSSTHTLVIVDGHHVFVRYTAVFKDLLNDTDYVINTIDYSKIGFTHLPITVKLMGGNDVANAICHGTLGQSDGRALITDITPKASGGTVTVGTSVILEGQITLSENALVDSCCDKFYWKRVS